MANIGTAAQFAEPTARGIQKTDYREPSKEYSLRSREEAERRENERSRDIALKEGRDLRTWQGRDYSEKNPYLQNYVNRADQLIRSGGEDIERAKEGAGKLGKLAVDVGANAAQMAGDALTNMAFPGLGMLSLASRASGTASYEARQDGMGVNEQFLYGQGTGLIEALSEGIFNSVSAFHAAYGKGAFSLADKLNMRSAASKIVQDYIKTEGGKALVNNLSRLGAGMLEEGIEEIVAGLAEPALKYVLQKSSDPMAKWEGYDWAELGYDFLVGALMGGLGGAASLPGQVMGDVALKSQAMMDGNDYAQSLVDMARVQGREGARTSDAEILAEQIQGQIDQGLTIQPSQARMLQRAIGESRQANEQAFNERATQQYQKAADEGRAAKVQSRGTMEEAIGFNRRVTEDLKDNIEVARLTMGEGSSKASQEAVGRYITGEADTVDIDIILSDKDAKKAVEELTGLKLSMKNTEAREQLEDRTVLNRMENRDRLLAKTHEDIRTNMNARGGEVFKANYDEAVKTIGTRNAPEIYESIYSRFYTDGTVEGSSFKESYDRIVKPLTEDFGEELGSKIRAVFTKDFAQKVFMAGQTALAEVRAKGTTTEISKKAASAPSGFTYESSARAKITDRQADLLQRFAEKANVHIRLVESIAGGAANGQYDPNSGVIMIAADSDNKLITVAKHELTHHLKATSPARYQELEDFVLKEWYNDDPEALEDKISEYQHRYRDITAEEAREELIADASEAFFTDKAAISHAVSFSEKLGRALHKGIKDLLNTFVDLQEGDDRAYKGYGDFMDDIGVLRKAEKMWLDALNESANRGTDSKALTDFLEENNLTKLPQPKNSLKEDGLTNAQYKFFKNSKAIDKNGHLVTVYHTTDKGGFTVFDPSKSDDRRSLFFSSSFDVSQTYSRRGQAGATREFKFPSKKDYKSFEDFSKDFKEVSGEDVMDLLRIKIRDRKTDRISTKLGSTDKERLEAWLNMAKAGQDVSNYYVDMDSPDFLYGWNAHDIYVNNLQDLLSNLSDAMSREEPSGNYACYLNLENPLVVDGRGSSWSQISYRKIDSNPTRDKTLKRMEEEAKYVIDSVQIEWVIDVLNDGLRLGIQGKKKNNKGNLENWTVSKLFDAYSYAPGEKDPTFALVKALTDYWVDDLGLGLDYFDEVENHVNRDGDVDYSTVDANQEGAPDYINEEGDKLDYAEIFDEFSEEDGFLWSPYEGIRTGRYRTRDLAQIAENDGYDGVVIRNIRDIGGSSNLKSGASPYSDIYIAFHGDQVKLTSNENPTSNEDIRYSMKEDHDQQGFFDELTSKGIDEESARIGAEALATTKKLKKKGKGKNTPYNTLAVSFYEKMIKDGSASLLGHKFKNKHDLAQALQMYRDPRYETCRLFFLDKNNRIVMQTGVTNRLPSRSSIVAGKNAEEQIRYVNSLFNSAVRQGAVAFYVSHNHPSGDPTPSRDDYAVNAIFKNFADQSRGDLKYRGQIVIDHNTYAYMNPYKKAKNFGEAEIYTTWSTRFGEGDPLLKNDEESKRMGMNKDLRTKNAIAEQLFSYNTPEDKATLLYLSAKMQGKAVQTVELSHIKKSGSHTVRQELVKRARNFGAYAIVLGTNSIKDEKTERILDELFDNGTLLDVFTYGEENWYKAFTDDPSKFQDFGASLWKEEEQKAPEQVGEPVKFSVKDKPIDERKQAALNSSGIAEASDGTVAKFSLKSWVDTDKAKKLKALVEAGHGRREASKWIDDINSIASIILSDQTRLDYVADRRYKAIKPNGDYYKKTFDNSTLCDKRRLYQGTYNAIQKALPQLPLTEDLVIEIRDMLNKKGLESPCGICYVESMRKNLGRYAKDWYDTYARKDEITLADVTTSDGFVNLRKTKPEIAEAFEKAMNAKGVSSPKVVQLRTDYREEIMRMPQSTVDYLNKIGGLRFHSFSDFETPHLIDTMQAIMCMAAKKLAGMAYTKVVNFPAVFGGTGMKINLSLIIKTDENGNAVYEDYTDENGETKKRLVFDSKEGIDYEEASKWRDKYPDDVAFIVVGKDKQTTLDAIADPRIDYVIPFHRSKWSQENLEKLGLKGYEDFATGHQDNKILLDEYWNYNKSGKENAEAYLKKCAEKGVKPVFEQLLVDNGNGSYSLQKDGSTDNYWKLLIEGKMYNHLTKKGVKQKPVVPNFDMDEARRILNEYEGGANDLPVAEGVVKEFVEKHKKDKYSLKDRTPFYEREGYESSYQIAKRQQGEMREGREKQRRIGQIADIHKRLTDKLFKPTDDKHLPDDYAPAVEDVLSRFNFTTEGMEKWAAKNGRRSKSMNSMNNLQRILRRMAEAEGGEIAVDADLLPIVEDLTDILGDGEVKLSDLSSTELANIKRLFSAFEHQINSYNKMFVEGKKETAAQSAARTFDEMAKDNKWKLGIMGRVFNGKGTTNFNPSDFFELIGGEIYDLYQGARTGFDRYVRNTDNAKTFIQNTVNNKVADRWANKTRIYTTSSGDEITLTDAQLMGLYCLSKREQAQEHIYIGGVISAPVKVKKKLTTRELEEKRVVPTQEDILSWVSKLSAEQREVADKIQNYLSTVPSEWGNETSMIMYGYKKFNEKMYYPIQSSQDYLDSTFDQAAGDPTLRNIGPSKAITKGANNAIVVDDIFTVFSKHIAQMASYNAYVPAIADFQRVWNFNDRENGRKVKARFKEAYGRDAYNYVDDFFKSLNGVYKNGFDGGGVLNWAGGMFKKAAVGGNVRVLVQQPTAIARAALLINPAYLTAAIPMATAHPKRTYQEMMDHVPIAKWKAWGFYSTDVSSASKNLRDIMIGSEAITDKVFMDMYGAADNMTWTAIFKACQLQVEAQNKGLKKGSDEYWDKVSKLASRVFDRTQVVDSPFHRSNLMKSKDTGTKMATAFMAEPTKTVNMLNTEITLAARELRNGKPGKAIAIFTRVGMVFTANAALLACGQALVDAMRHTGGDDDKDKGKYGDRWVAYWKDNFVKNLEVIGMIPILKDVQSVWEGYDVTRMDMQGIKRVVQSTQYLKKYLEDPANSKYTGYEEWSNVAFAIAYTMGVPVANVKRDFEALVLTGAEAANDPNVALFFMKNKYQVNSKTKSLWIDYYLDSIEKGNEGLARNVKKYITSNGVITEEDIQKKANDRHRANPSEEEKARIKQSMDTLEKSDAWKNADPDDREYYSNVIEKYDLGIEDSQTDSVKKYAEENNLSFEDAITSKLAGKQKDAEETEAIDKSMAKISKDSEWQELNEKQQKYYKDVLNEIIRGTESGRADAVKSQVTSKKTVEDVIIEGVHKGNEYIDKVSSTDIWKEATDDQKSQMETVLRKVGLGISDTQTTPYTKYEGLSPEQVALYKLALKKADERNNGNKSYDSDEKRAALEMLRKNYKISQEQENTLLGKTN